MVVAVGGEAREVSTWVGVRNAVMMLPINALKVAVAVKNTCYPREACARRVVLFHWQHGA